MEPIAETLAAVAQLERYGDTGLATSLSEISAEVCRIVPEVVGLSLTTVFDSLTFTLTTTGERLQHVAPERDDPAGTDRADRGGGAGVRTVDDAMNETSWRLGADTNAADGVASTLSLPIMRDGTVVAGLNLYASTPDAFEGKHKILADACGAWSPGIVTNADLPFSTQDDAVHAPGRIVEQRIVAQATGVLAAVLDLDLGEAADRLALAAERSGLSQAAFARGIVALLDHQV